MHISCSSFCLFRITFYKAEDDAIGSVRAWSTGIATVTKAEKTRDRPGRYENELAGGRKMFAPFVLALTPSNRRYVRSLVRQEEIFKCNEKGKEKEPYCETSCESGRWTGAKAQFDASISRRKSRKRHKFRCLTSDSTSQIFYFYYVIELRVSFLSPSDF